MGDGPEQASRKGGLCQGTSLSPTRNDAGLIQTDKPFLQ